MLHGTISSAVNLHQGGVQEATLGPLVPFYLLVRTLVKDSMKLAPTLSSSWPQGGFWSKYSEISRTSSWLSRFESDSSKVIDSHCIDRNPSSLSVGVLSLLHSVS